MSRGKDVPGNVLATQAVIVRNSLRVTGVMDRVENAHRSGSDHDPWLVGFRVKFPEDEEGEFFIVLQGEDSAGAMVAFHSSISLGEAIRGALERYMNGSLKWRKDVYRNGD